MFSRIYKGHVYHKRFKPKVHELKYRVCSFLFDLDELDRLDQDLKLFSHNRFNILSFWDKDHGRGDGTPLRPYVNGVLKQAGINTDGGPVRLLCYPRLFGYVFNPLSVYYCFDRNEILKAIIYEVSNTFSQRHSYVIAHDQADAPLVRQHCRKGFYVSPFMEMECDYAFAMSLPEDKISVVIDQSDADGLLLKAYFKGEAQDLSDKSLLNMLLRYPLMTLKVIVGIHWEALKLWRKGLKLVARPDAPAHPVTLVSSRSMENEK